MRAFTDNSGASSVLRRRKKNLNAIAATPLIDVQQSHNGRSHPFLDVLLAIPSAAPEFPKESPNLSLTERKGSSFQQFDLDRHMTFPIAPPKIDILDRFSNNLDPNHTHLFLHDALDLPKSLFDKIN